MNKSDASFIGDRLLARTGRWSPLIITALMLLSNTIFVILLTAIPVRFNTDLSQTRGISLLTLGGILLLVRNVILLTQVYAFNRDMFAQLSKRARPEPAEIDAAQERRAWRQITSLGENNLLFGLAETFALVLFPMLGYACVVLKIGVESLISLSAAVTAAALTAVVLESLLIEIWLAPVRTALLPAQFEAQLAGMKGFHFRPKLQATIIALVFVSMLQIVSTAYRQHTLISLDESRFPQLLTNALLQILFTSVGAIATGIVLSTDLASSFARSPRQLIEVFEEIEKGDPNRRAKVLDTDEMGELSI